MIGMANMIAGRRTGFRPRKLFHAGEQGFLNDTLPASSLFTTAAGSTNSTLGDPVGREESLITPQNNATQGTAGARPTLGRTPRGGVRNRFTSTATLSTQNVTTTNVAWTLSFKGTGTVTLTGTSTAGPLVGTGVNDRVSLTFTPTAGTLTCTVSGSCAEGQIEVGSAATAYQAVGISRYDVTEAGVPSIPILWFDGINDLMTFGTTTLGGCNLYCGASDRWMIAGGFWSFTSDITLISRASATSGNRTFQWFIRSDTFLAINLRGTLTTGVTATAVNDGAWHTYLIWWDGTTLRIRVDSSAVTTASVGSAAEESGEDILVGARTSAALASFFVGGNNLILGENRIPSSAEQNQIMSFLNSYFRGV